MNGNHIFLFIYLFLRIVATMQTTIDKTVDGMKEGLKAYNSTRFPSYRYWNCVGGVAVAVAKVLYICSTPLCNFDRVFRFFFDLLILSNKKSHLPWVVLISSSLRRKYRVQHVVGDAVGLFQRTRHAERIGTTLESWIEKKRTPGTGFSVL